jgi:hypothetical protein
MAILAVIWKGEVEGALSNHEQGTRGVNRSRGGLGNDSWH